RRDDQPHIWDPEFRYVSVITGLNSHRDRLNEMNSRQFAQDHHQPLTHFYSIDKWRTNADSESKPGRKRKRTDLVDPLRKSNAIALGAQQILWNLPHAVTDHHPGRLSLCKGMHVMIKKNEATELGVTNGAEGTVVGW
ncbi:hypothetical protein FA95DRAFT_1476613, partial [Auriscalpium vulgare]